MIYLNLNNMALLYYSILSIAKMHPYCLLYMTRYEPLHLFKRYVKCFRKVPNDVQLAVKIILTHAYNCENLRLLYIISPDRSPYGCCLYYCLRRKKITKKKNPLLLLCRYRVCLKMNTFSKPRRVCIPE